MYYLPNCIIIIIITSSTVAIAKCEQARQKLNKFWRFFETS